MRKKVILFLFIFIYVIYGPSCQKSSKLDTSDSLASGPAICANRTPLATLRTQVYRTLGATPITSRPLVTPRPQPQLSDELIPRTSEIPAVFSKDSTLFGVEVEIPESGELNLNYAKMLFEVLVHDKLKSCKLDLTSWKWDQNYRFKLTDEKRTPKNIVIYVRTDPAVVEISTTPLTYAQTESWQDVLEELIFATSRELNQDERVGSPDHGRNRWSGHLNISWPGLMTSMGFHDVKELKTYYGSKVRLAGSDIERQNMNLLLNLFVDLQNHPQLAMGILGGDVRNASPLAFGSREEQEALREVIKRYEGGYISNLLDLTQRLIKAYPASFVGRYSTSRYALLNLENIINPDYSWGYMRGTRIELRGFFSPLSVSEMLANYRIVNNRLAYLYDNFTLQKEKLKDFNPPKIDENYIKNAQLNNFKVEGLTGGLSAEEAAKVYIRFLSEAGLNPRVEAQFIRDPLVQKIVENSNQCR